MRSLILAAAILAAAPAHAYDLVDGSYDANFGARQAVYMIAVRELVLAKCPSLARGPSYGRLERTLRAIPGANWPAMREAIVLKVASVARQERMTWSCEQGLGQFGTPSAHPGEIQPAPGWKREPSEAWNGTPGLVQRPVRDVSRMTVKEMICRGLTPPARNFKADDASCALYR